MTPWVGHFEVITRSAHAHLMCHEPRRLQQESVFLTYIGFLSLASRPTLVPSQRPGRLPPLALSIHMRFFIWQATFRRQRVKRPIVSPNLFLHGVLVRISSLCTSQTKQPANSMKKRHGYLFGRHSRGIVFARAVRYKVQVCERVLDGLAGHSKRPCCVGQADVFLNRPLFGKAFVLVN